MTRVTFYILKGSQQAGLQTLCRIAGKAVQKGHRVFIHSSDEPITRQLDELMWTYEDSSFLAHEIAGKHDANTTILIGQEAPEEFDDVFINLSAEVPPAFSRFQRVVEFVSGDDAQRSAARDRYRFYKDRGYPLETHEL